MRVSFAIEELRAAHEANEPERWHDARRRLDLAIEHATRSRDETKLADTEIGATLTEARLHELERTSAALHDPPSGVLPVAREAEIVAALACSHDGGATVAFARKETALRVELELLGAPDRRVLLRRLAIRRPNDELSTLFHRLAPERRQRLIEQLRGLRSPRTPPNVPSSRHRYGEPERAEELRGAIRSALQDDVSEETLAELFASLDVHARRELSEQLTRYRQGNGDDLAARFTRLERSVRVRLLAILDGATPMPQQIARDGVMGASSPLPHRDAIQRAFGRHDVASIDASVGGEAAHAATELGAHAYATGERIAFATQPDLHTTVHEAAHVVQQRAGLGDESHAELVAHAVVSGLSAEALLDAPTNVAAAGVQRRDESGPARPSLDQLLALVRSPNVTVDDVVALLDLYPEQQAAVLREAESAKGKLFADAVIAKMGSNRGQCTSTGTHRDERHPPYGRSVVDDLGAATHEAATIRVVTDSRGSIETRPHHRQLAAHHESIAVADTDGNRLDIECDYRIEVRPGELAAENTYITTDRKLVLRTKAGAVLQARILGEARAILEAGTDIDPVREIHETSIAPAVSAQLYIPATEQFLPSVFGAEGKSSLAAAAASPLLTYDDPLLQLSAMKRALQGAGVHKGVGQLERMHARLPRLRQDAARAEKSVLEHIAARRRFEDGSPLAVVDTEEVIYRINETIGEISGEQSGSADVAELVAMRTHMLELRERARTASPPDKSLLDHAGDVIGIPGRLVERVGDGALELGKTYVDFCALAGSWAGRKTGLWHYGWNPISSAGKAAENGASSADIARGLVTGIVDQWASAIEHARNGDYTGLLDNTVDAALLAASAVDAVELATVKGPELVAKATTAIREARTLITRRVPVEIADNAAALAKTLEVWLGGDALEVATSGGVHGGPPIPQGLSFASSKAQGLALKLDRTRNRMLVGLGQRVTSSTSTQLAEWAVRVERVFAGDAKLAQRYFHELELRGLGKRYLDTVTAVIDSQRLGSDQVVQALLHSIKATFSQSASSSLSASCRIARFRRMSSKSCCRERRTTPSISNGSQARASRTPSLSIWEAARRCHGTL